MFIMTDSVTGFSSGRSLSVAILLTSVVPTVYILWTCFLTCARAVMAVVGAVVRTDYQWGEGLRQVRRSENHSLILP